MSVPEIMIVALAVVELLAVVAMGIAAFMVYRRVNEVAAWAQPTVQEAKAIATRGQTLARETRARAIAFPTSFRTLAQHVNQKVQTTTRLAREAVHPALPPIQEASRALTGPDGLAARLSRLHEAGKIAAGRRDDDLMR
jgi:hypothetical protein